MKLLALLLLLFCTTGVWGRAWNQGECGTLAQNAGAAAQHRQNGVPLPLILKALKEAADRPQKGTSILRFDGDYEAIEALVTAVYNSTYTGEQAYIVVWTRCDRMGLSRTVKDT